MFVFSDGWSRTHICGSCSTHQAFGWKLCCNATYITSLNASWVVWSQKWFWFSIFVFLETVHFQLVTCSSTWPTFILLIFLWILLSLVQLLLIWQECIAPLRCSIAESEFCITILFRYNKVSCKLLHILRLNLGYDVDHYISLIKALCEQGKPSMSILCYVKFQVWCEDYQPSILPSFKMTFSW